MCEDRETPRSVFGWRCMLCMPRVRQSVFMIVLLLKNSARSTLRVVPGSWVTIPMGNQQSFFTSSWLPVDPSETSEVLRVAHMREFNVMPYCSRQFMIVCSATGSKCRENHQCLMAQRFQISF